MTRFVRPLDNYLARPITLEPIRTYWINDAQAESSSITFGTISFWSNARSALAYAVSQIKSNGATISYSTTSGSRYLSSCVSESIPHLYNTLDFAETNRDLFVADFGYRNSFGDSVSKIYDDAWSLDLEKAQDFLSHGGRHYISSLPKVLGLPFGGIMISNSSEVPVGGNLEPGLLEDIQALFWSQLPQLGYFQEMNAVNRSILIENHLGPHGFRDYFESGFSKSGVSVLSSPSNFDEKKFKARLQDLGVRGTAFFGNNAVILPSHYLLSESDIAFVADSALTAFRSAVV